MDRNPYNSREAGARDLEEAAKWLQEAAHELRLVGTIGNGRISDANTYHKAFWRVTHAMRVISDVLDNPVRNGIRSALHELEDRRAGRWSKAQDGE